MRKLWRLRKGEDTARQVQVVYAKGLDIRKGESNGAGPADARRSEVVAIAGSRSSEDDDNAASVQPIIEDEAGSAGDEHGSAVGVQTVPTTVGWWSFFRLGRARRRVERSAARVLRDLLRSRHRASTGRWAADQRSEPYVRARRAATHSAPLLARWLLIALDLAIFAADFFFIRGVLSDLQDSVGFLTSANLSSLAIALFTPLAVIVTARTVGVDLALAWHEWARVRAEAPDEIGADDRYPPSRSSQARTGLFGWVRFVHPRALLGVVLLVVVSVVFGGVAWWRFDHETIGIGAVQAPVEFFVIVFVVLPWIAVFAHARAWDADNERQRRVLRRAWIGGWLASRENSRLSRLDARLARAHTALHDRLEHLLRRMEVPFEVVARLMLEQTVYSGEHRVRQLTVVPYATETSGKSSWGSVVETKPQLESSWTVAWLDRRVRAALQVLHHHRPLGQHLQLSDSATQLHEITHRNYASDDDVAAAAAQAAQAFRPVDEPLSPVAGHPPLRSA